MSNFREILVQTCFTHTILKLYFSLLKPLFFYKCICYTEYFHWQPRRIQFWFSKAWNFLHAFSCLFLHLITKNGFYEIVLHLTWCEVMTKRHGIESFIAIVKNSVLTTGAMQENYNLCRFNEQHIWYWGMVSSIQLSTNRTCFCIVYTVASTDVT